MKKVYKSKIDLWLAALLAVVMILSLFIGLRELGDRAQPSQLPAVFILTLGVLVPFSSLFFTRYTILDKTLLVRSGGLRWSIPLKEISDIAPSKDPKASPALSLDRIRIDYGKNKYILISPKNKDEFLIDLREAVMKASGPI